MDKEKPGFLSLAWFKPLWRRLAVIGIIVAWAIWEWFFNHDQLWGFITLVMLAYGVWTFFINFDKELAQQDHDKPEN